MTVTIKIDPSCTDDYIQAQLLKGIFILRHRQNTTKSKYLDHVANDAKWEVFWGAVSRYSASIVRNEDDEYNDFLTNYSLLYTNEHLDDWENDKSCSLRNECKVSIGTSEWLPLHCCVFNSAGSDKYSKVLSLACVQSSENKKDVETKVTPLHLAIQAKNPNMKVIKKILKHFRSMTSVKTAGGQIPLHYAAENSNNIEVIELLIEAYPKGLKKKCSKGEVPLFNACRNCSDNSLQILQKLLQASPHSIKSINEDGETPLHATVSELFNSYSNTSVLVDIMKILLIAYPDSMTIQDNDGNTPLHILCSYARRKKAIYSVFEQMLLMCPAAAAVLNQSRQTPLHILLEYDEGFRKDWNRLVPMLLDVYPEAVSVRDTHCCYPIHYAMTNNLNLTHIQRIVEGHPTALLAMGKLSMTYTEMTPIQLSLRGYSDIPEAKSRDKLALVKYLYSICPESIHIRSSSHDTVLYTAVEYCNDSNKNQIVEAVYHMDPSAAMSVNSNGETPLQRATRIAIEHPNYPFLCLEQVRFLARMCPAAITMKNKVEGISPLEDVVSNRSRYYRRDKSEMVVVYRLLLQAVSGVVWKE